MSLESYNLLLNKESIKNLPEHIENPQNSNNLLDRVKFFRPKTEALIKSIQEKKISDSEKEILLNRAASLILAKAKDTFMNDPNVFVEHYVISSLSKKYEKTLREKFAVSAVEECQNLSNGLTELELQELINKKISEKLQDKLYEKKNNQIYRLKTWFDYLLVENTFLPPWYKYLALRSIVTFVDRDTKSQNRKRTNETAEQFLQLDRQALPKVLNQIQEPGREALKFFELYKSELQNSKLEKSNILDQFRVEDFKNGTWKFFEGIKTEKQFEDLEPGQKLKIEELNTLSKNTPWCLADPETALNYLKEGQIRIYSIQENPVLALNFQENEPGKIKLREARGVGENEEFSSNLLEVIQGIYENLESEGLIIPTEFISQIEDERIENQRKIERKKINTLIGEAVKQGKIQDLDISDIKSFFELYNKELTISKQDETKDISFDNEVVNSYKAVSDRLVKEVYNFDNQDIKSFLLPVFGSITDQEYYDTGESSDSIDINIAFRPYILKGFAGYKSDIIKSVEYDYSDDEDYEDDYIEVINTDLDIYNPSHSNNQDGEHEDYHMLKIASYLEIYDALLTKIPDSRDELTLKLMPYLERVQNLKVQNSNVVLPGLAEIGELTLSYQSKVELPKINKIEKFNLGYNKKFELPKDRKIDVSSITMEYDPNYNSYILSRLNLNSLENLIIEFDEEPFKMKFEYLNPFIQNGLDVNKLSFHKLAGGKYTYDQLQSLVVENGLEKVFDEKLNSFSPKLDKNELAFVLGIQELPENYTKIGDRVKVFFENIKQYPVKLKQYVVDYYSDYSNIELKSENANNNTQVIFDVDPSSSLNSDEFENLSNLVVFRGGLLTIYDENSKFSNLSEVYGDLDLSYLTSIPDLSKLKKVTGKVFVSSDIENLVEMKEFIEKLQTQTNSNFEEV